MLKVQKSHLDRLNKIKKYILDILFPIECLGCAKENIWLCEECFKKIKLTQKDRCIVCKNFSDYGKTHEWCAAETNLDGVIIAVDFNDKLLKSIIHKFKYNFIRDLSNPLSKILINKIISLDKKEDAPNWARLLFGDDLIIIPMPLHKQRLRRRGFNQAEMLAKNLAEKFNLIMRPYILQRKKNTPPQTKLKRKKRLKNIKGAFQVNKEWSDKLKNTKILLVDDVMTTGATLNECALVLKECGVREVWGIVLARG